VSVYSSPAADAAPYPHSPSALNRECLSPHPLPAVPTTSFLTLNKKNPGASGVPNRGAAAVGVYCR
jgi:hypothetical protein